MHYTKHTYMAIMPMKSTTACDKPIQATRLRTCGIIQRMAPSMPAPQSAGRHPPSWRGFWCRPRCQAVRGGKPSVSTAFCFECGRKKLHMLQCHMHKHVKQSAWQSQKQAQSPRGRLPRGNRLLIFGGVLWLANSPGGSGGRTGRTHAQSA